ncbi:hypothetical protein CSIM01_03804 [Colletotrichum simmondsii]|uniref:Uncharacterized protein n=1 Tax=Colletotrichum simmondsii TaxID=703756 RepID=A0A135TMU8_9PEZI|nr:hypothetical protein CSIM01_03804 [Colletotrichum simmondsii]
MREVPSALCPSLSLLSSSQAKCPLYDMMPLPNARLHPIWPLDGQWMPDHLGKKSGDRGPERYHPTPTTRTRHKAKSGRRLKGLHLAAKRLVSASTLHTVVKFAVACLLARLACHHLGTPCAFGLTTPPGHVSPRLVIFEVAIRDAQNAHRLPLIRCAVKVAPATLT